MRTNGKAALTLLVSLAAVAAGCTDSVDAPDGSGGGSGSGSGTIDDPTGTGTIVPDEPAVVAHPDESDADLVNPERGFYLRYDLAGAGDASRIRSAGYSLAIAYVDLSAYRASALPASLLGQLGNGFARARSAGIKLVVRFAYNQAFAADAPLAQVLGHIAQLAPVLQANQDVIAVVQAGFVGAWGEWHSSTNGLTDVASRHAIIAALLDAVPASRSVQLRKPSFKRDFVDGTLGAGEAFTGSARARLGHHNDCFLASDTDLGTYDAPADQWRTYVANDTAYVPMGGETCIVYPARTSCSAALAEMAAHHWTYLNHEYNTAVIGGWAAGGCEDDIRRGLGYRFAATRVAHSARVAPGGVLGLEIDVANRGFAVPMNARPVDVVLIGADGSRQVARLAFDARRIAAGGTTTIGARLRLPATLAAGTYTIALRLPDAAADLAADPRYAIQLANTGTWNEATGDNLLARDVVVDTAAPGDRDPAATTFAPL